MAVHVGGGDQGSMLVVGAVPRIVSAFTRAGMTAPVFRLKAWWPIAWRMAPIEPEWLVNEIQVLRSWMNTSSKSVFMRTT